MSEPRPAGSAELRPRPLVWWLKLGFLSFGGPAGQIALMHHELVERRRWISEKRFLHALNFCMLLPGPEAQQLATYIGWLMHRTRGGIAAGALFVLPSLVDPDRAVVALRRVRRRAGDRRRVLRHQAGGDGDRRLRRVPARLARADERLDLVDRRRSPSSPIAVARLPFPLVIALAAAIGFVGGRIDPAKFSLRGGHGAATASHGPAVIDDDTPTPPHARLQPRPLRARAARLARALGRRDRRARRSPSAAMRC